MFKQLKLYIKLQHILLTMYYEKAEVKQYHRKNKEGVKVPYYQINLSKKSKFSEVKPIALIDISEVKKLATFLEANPIEEKEAEINELKAEIVEYKQQLQEYKATVESLSSEVEELKEDKIQLQEELLTYKDHYKDKLEELTEEKETSKGLLASITKLNNEKAEVEKENVFLKSRGFLSRLINKQYVKENDVPEIVEAKPPEE